MTAAAAPPGRPPPATSLRPGRDDDAAGFIRLVGEAWAEHPGCILDVDRENPELRALATHFAAAGGALWVAERGGEMLGMIGARPLLPDGEWEICRVYVRGDQRGGGLAHVLLDAAEGHASAAGATRLLLWTDTRFAAAHAFYEKRGYLRRGPLRPLDDLSRSIEFRYAKPARGLAVEPLDAAAAASAERRLSSLLVECVAAGAAVSSLPPLAPAVAPAYWRGVSSEVASGQRVLLAAWLDGRLAGTVQLHLATAQNQPHRAGVEKLLVEPTLRRRGVARALLARAERSAGEAGRTLLTLDTRAGDAGEALYRALGWHEAGCIPGYALDGSGRAHDARIFYRHLGETTASPRGASH